MANKHVFPVERLRRFMEEALATLGMPAAEATIVADNLIKADLWGLGTHGVSRFPVYFKRMQEGAVNPCPDIKISNPWPAVLAVDGDNGPGAVVGVRALEEAMVLAEKYGLAAAGIKMTNHFGAAGYYCDIAAKQNYITIILADSPASIPPWGGKQAYFGTNPIAIGLPRREQPPVIVDLATSIVARGKIISAAKKGETIPEGWAMDKDGVPTTDAQAALAGTLLPMAGPKGYALGLAVEHLAGVLTGSAFGRDVAWQYSEEQKPSNVGNILIVIRADAFMGLDEYYDRTEKFCHEIKGCEKAAGVDEIFLPGERKRASERIVAEKGIEVAGSLLEELQAIAWSCGLSLDK
ncbi:MAG: Ldh family oxidoreductase [Negativicutes bacterium]|nr:Ldh family oxidoreductase [Negativicutes bacterium]